MDPERYMDVRRLAEQGKSMQEITAYLKTKECSPQEIAALITEYASDEKSSVDDKLIASIEEAFSKKRSIEEIITQELHNGHSRFEIQKALLRARLSPQTFFSIEHDLSVYVVMQIIALVGCIVLGLLIHPALLYAVAIIICLNFFAILIHAPKRSSVSLIELAGLGLFILLTLWTGFFINMAVAVISAIIGAITLLGLSFKK